MILAGTGDRSFCAVAAGEPIHRKQNPEWGFAGIVTHPISVPVTAAVNGVALGGGTELVPACDIAFAAEHARFGSCGLTRGLIAGAGAHSPSQTLPRKVAVALFLVGETSDGELARYLGLINGRSSRSPC